MSVLKIFKNYFKCGRIFVNKRYDNHNEHLYRYCVRSLDDISEKIVPFFKEHKLKTAKINDFLIFAKIIKLGPADIAFLHNFHLVNRR